MTNYLNSYTKLPPHFFAEQSPTPVSDPNLIAFNVPLSEELGLDFNNLNELQLAQLFSGNQLPAWSQPIATAYAGHQFGHLVPQLGDGRAVLLGEVENGDVSAEIQLKGAGRTPYSRGGDGRSWLGPVLREYLVSEAMHQFGIPTTRALAAVSTGDSVMRETELPGGILCRTAKSHLRIGTFLNFAVREDLEALQVLVEYAVARLYPELKGNENSALALLEKLVEKQAFLIAKWMSVGFIHGVMNTDNMSISGETIDYGPCAFMDNYEADKVFSSIDRRGRYAYSRQPAIAHWNLVQFAGMLLPLINTDQQIALEAVQSKVDRFPKLCRQFWRAEFAKKLGLLSFDENDDQLIDDLLLLLEGECRDFTLSFRFLASNQLPATEDFDAWRARWKQRLQQDGVAFDEMLEARLWQVNPILIPRNHQIEQLISQAVERNDFSHFHMFLEAMQTPFSPSWHGHELAVPPLAEERVLKTFCGT